MTFHLLSLILAGILSFADYVTEHIFSEKVSKNRKHINIHINAIKKGKFPNLFSFLLNY